MEERPADAERQDQGRVLSLADGYLENARLNPYCCPVCQDVREIEWMKDSQAYPCPYCATFVIDEKKKISKTVKKYGNPFILSEGDYERFRTHRKLDGFRPYPEKQSELTEEEFGRFKTISTTYLGANEKFCVVWARYNP